MIKGFLAFLQQYGVIGLAIAVVIGGKLNMWVTSLVDNIIMPFVGLAIPGGDWREMVIPLGNTGAALGIGAFLGATLDFVIVAFFVYAVFNSLLRNVSLGDDMDKKLGRTVPPADAR